MYNSLTPSNTMKKVVHTDMQLSSRSNGCWSAIILSAMDGLTQSYIFKLRLQNCEPIDLSRFVDLKETSWSSGHLILTHPREHNSKPSTYHQWCALPTRRALVTHSPYILPKYMFLNLPRDVICITACFSTSCPHPMF